MQRRRVALIIPDGIIRKGVEGLIKQSRLLSYDVMAFNDFMAFRKQTTTVDLLLLDITGCLMRDAEDWLQKIRHDHPHVRVIVISGRLMVRHIRRVMQLGAKGFIYREDLSESLLSSIDLVSRDVVTMSSQAMQALANHDQLYAINELKPLDMQVLHLTAQGRTVKQIAAQLHVSTRSVYRSRDKLREVLDVPTNEMLLDAAREQGLLDSEGN